MFIMKNLTTYLWSILLLLILLYAAPTLIKGIKEQYKDILKPKAKVARIKINGPIYETDFYQQNLEKFFKNKEIKAILLEIDSPGGATGSSQALYNEIIYLKMAYKKPIIALTYNLCASGAYNIAIGADYIIATPSALIGSIGNYIQQFKAGELLEQWHIHYQIKKTGTYKAATNPFIPSTPEQDQMLQELSQNAYHQFIQDVACRRKLSLKNSADWANGRIFTGNQAIKNGLIDEIGSEYNATKKIKELALIDREIEWVKPSYPSFLKQLFSRDSKPLLAICNQLSESLMNSFTRMQVE